MHLWRSQSSKCSSFLKSLLLFWHSIGFTNAPHSRVYSSNETTNTNRRRKTKRQQNAKHLQKQKSCKEILSILQLSAASQIAVNP